jgi:hypothetical protein
MNALADFVSRTATAVNPLILPFAVLCGLVLASVAVSFVALLKAAGLAREAALRTGDGQAADSEAIESLRREWKSLSAQLVEIRQQAAAVVPAPPRPGLNLSKRSQALRMHRRGDAPGEIASSLGIPLQEVDLLLKVHQIVISNI